MKTKFIALILIAQIFFCQFVFAQDNRGVKNLSVSKLPAKEKRFALIIGVDNYQKDITPLYGSVNDAKVLRDVLIKNAGFPENQVILMTTDSTDADLIPNRGNILDQLDRLSSQVPEDGLMLFSFSGHGISIDGDAFLIPSDGRIYQNIELMRERAIDVLRIKKAIKETKAKQVLMFLDACRNQPVQAKGDTANNLTEAYKNGFSFEVANKGVEAFATIYATSLGSRAYEFLDKKTQQYRGYFSKAIEDALTGKAANEKGEITLAGLISYIEKTVPKQVKTEKGQDQIPSTTVSDTYKANELVLAIGNNSPTNQNTSNPTTLPSGSSSNLLNTKSPEQYYAAAALYFQKGDYNNALSEINKALEISPAYAQAYTIRAMIYHVTNNHNQAIADATKAIELNLQNEAPYLIRGASFNVSGKYNEGLADFNNALKFNPQSGAAHYGRGTSYSYKGDNEKALEEFSKSIELGFNDAQVFYNRGVTYFKKNDFNRALSDFSKAIELNPQLGVAYLNRAIVYEKLGNKSLAEADQKKYYELAGKN